MTAKVARVINLFNALTGESLGKQDAGEGIRQKAWSDEVPQWALFAAQQQSLGVSGVGRLTNFPAHIEGGREFESNPIGQPSPKSTYNGHVFYRAVKQTAVLGVGDGSAASFGSEALSDGDRSSANYFNTTTDPDDPPAPRGATGPAFLQTIPDGGGDFSLSATSGVLTLRINGTLFTVTGLVDETSTEVVARLGAFGLPADVVDGASGSVVRIFAPGNGVTSTIEAITLAGDAGSVLFTGSNASSQPNVVYQGVGGPLGQIDNEDVVNAGKPQRRSLPGSVNILMTAASEVITVTDADKDGVLSGQNGAGTVTVTGTINYATGAVSVTMSGDAPDNATNVQASWKALIPLNLEEPVRVPVGGMDIAVELP